ncbi:MAG: hypothetical protein JW983_06400, partial [Elusimicrobia bacterium]|nr:hypothetical protein [Elusimicrobiota bacterium]
MYKRFLLLVLGLFLSSACLYAGVLTGSANLVLGQMDFVNNEKNCLDGGSVYSSDVAVDTVTGRVYSLEYSNNRVLWWNDLSSLTSGKYADGVLGQADFYSNGTNRGGSVSANTLNGPEGIAVDSSGNVWVADCNNNRVLKYNSPVSNGESAVLVLGQQSFTVNAENDSNGDGTADSVAENTMYGPKNIIVDSSGNVWVADRNNNRVLKFNTPTSNGEDADLVLGQQSFTVNKKNDSDGNNATDSVAANTLYWPEGVAVDSSGNVWVDDMSNHRVLKYNTPVGNGEDADIVLGQQSFTVNKANDSDGNNVTDSVAANTVYWPIKVAVDGSGNVWVVDLFNQRILKYNTPTASGEDADLVLGQQSFTVNKANDSDGDGATDSVAANTVDNPNGLTVDSSGNLWVADTSNRRILRYTTPTASGQDADLVLGQNNFTVCVTNFIEGREFDNPFSAVVSTKTGRVYVSDCNNNRILWWNNISSLANGESADGVLGQADFSSNSANRGCPVAANTLYYPFGIHIDSENNLWVADAGNNRVLKYNTPAANGENAVLVLGQQSFTVNAENDSDGNGVTDTVALNTIDTPYSVYVDVSGNLWVADAGNNRVLKYNTPAANGEDADLVLGQQSFTVNKQNDSNGDNATDSVAANTLYIPTGIAVDSSGNVWVTDLYNNRVLKYNTPAANGEDADLVLGQQSFTVNKKNDSNGDGATDSVAANTLYYPFGIYVDTSGNVWVADRNNNRILRYSSPSSNGEDADWVLGQKNFTLHAVNDSDGDGTPDSVAVNTLFEPTGITADGLGNIWVVDTYNNRVVKYFSLRPDLITPSHAANTGSVNITNLSGYEFVSGATVKLTMYGETDITATNVSVESLNKITCTFDLTGKRPGKRDIVVSKSGFTGILTNAFLIDYEIGRTQTILSGTDNTVTLMAETGNTVIEIPAGTFSGDVSMTVTVADVPLSGKEILKKTGMGVEISVSSGEQPLKPITLKINYRDSDIQGLDESKLKVCRYDSVNLRWIPLVTTVHASENYLEATIGHLSKFGVFQLAPAVTLDSVNVYPNPYKPNDAQ